LAIGDFQNAIMEEILNIDNIENIWDTEEIELKILNSL
jgi:kynurenine 3-monooxygenase